MKIIILKDNLKEGLIVSERSIGDTTNLPILKNVLIKSFDSNIQLTATNLELGVCVNISGKVIEEGSLSVPFDVLNAVISNIDSERINLETQGNTLHINTDNYDAKIQGIQAEEFPLIPKIKNSDSYIEINSDIFRNSLLQIISAAQISEIRPEISGILLDFQLTILKLVATDSFRLAEKTIQEKDFSTNIETGFKIIIPLKTAQEILRIFGENEALRFHFDENQILIKTKTKELISRLINGEYPDYKQIIPQGTETEIIIQKDRLMNAIKLVSSFSKRNNDIALKTKDSDKVLEVYSINQQVGENNYLIPIKLQGKNLKEISFNWRYLNDGLKVITTKEVHMQLNGDAKPTVLKPSDSNSGYFYIVMPVKTS